MVRSCDLKPFLGEDVNILCVTQAATDRSFPMKGGRDMIKFVEREHKANRNAMVTFIARSDGKYMLKFDGKHWWSRS